MARTQIEQELLDMLAAEKKRTVTASSSAELPDIPRGLFGEEPAPRTKQASASPTSADAYMDFLRPPSPGRNVAEVGLDALWQTPPPIQVQAADDGLSSLWSTPAPVAAVPAVEPELSALWGSPTADGPSNVEPELEGLWDTPGRSAVADDAGEALSGLFMNGDALAQAQMTGQDFEFSAADIQPMSRTASTRGDFNIEFDSDMNFGAEVRGASGGASAPRFRIDRPPALPTFNRGNVTAQDGVVVGQRGSDGRFQRTASARQAPPTATASRSEAVSRYETRTAAPAPAPRAEPVRYVAPSTKYDVLRKGGLDL